MHGVGESMWNVFQIIMIVRQKLLEAYSTYISLATGPNVGLYILLFLHQPDCLPCLLVLMYVYIKTCTM